MKKTSFYLMIILAMILVLAPIYLAAQGSQSADVLFGAALHQEEVEGDCEGAIETYKKLLAGFPDNRPLAAQAQFRIGVCYEKLGFQEAEKAFQKVVDNFPDQIETVKMAREKLSILQKAIDIVEKEDQGFKMTEIPIDPEKNYYSFISPDGKKLASVSMIGDIWVTDIASGKEIRLNQTSEFDFWCFWSPDSRKIAYMDAPNNLYVVSAQGGAPKTLIKVDENLVKEYGGCWPTGWSADSQKINCWTSKKGLIAIPISGGDWEDVFKYSSPEQEENYYMMSMSPNEKFISYNNKNSDNADIYIMPAGGGESVQITDHPANDSSAGWSYDGRWLFFISDRNGKLESWFIGISPDGKREGEPFQIPFLSTVPINSAISWTKDNQIGLSYGKQISNIFISNFDGSEEIQLTNMENWDWSPKWSPDNRYIAFISDRGGKEDIWIVPVKGGERKNISGRLTERPGVRFTRGIVWHPNSQSVSCWVYNGDNRETWTMDIQSGLAKKIPFDEGGYMHGMDWSPDGKRIAFDYYGGDPQNGIKDSEIMNSNIYTISAEGGKAVRMSKVKEDGLSFSLPRWSPDGKRIAFISEDGRIWIVGSEGGESHAITDKSGEIIWNIIWSPDGENILFSRTEGQKYIYYSVSSQGGDLQKLNVDSLSDISPDGKKIVYSKNLKTINQFWLLENFLPEKKKD